MMFSIKISSTSLLSMLLLVIIIIIVDVELSSNDYIHHRQPRHRKKRIKFCKIDNIFECFVEPGLYLSGQHNGTGIPKNSIEFEQFCFNQYDYGPYCARKWLQKCSTGLYLNLFDYFYLKPLQMNIRKLCEHNGTIRNDFLEIAPCLIDKVKLSAEYRTQCIRPLQLSFEMIHQQMKSSKNLTQFYLNTCCSYHVWEKCFNKMLIEKNCGEKSKKSFHLFIDYNSFNILNFLCPSYQIINNKKQACNNYKLTIFNQIKKRKNAPEDPKGFQSSNFFSHLFSYYCPNIGYGIDDGQ